MNLVQETPKLDPPGLAKHLAEFLDQQPWPCGDGVAAFWRAMRFQAEVRVQLVDIREALKELLEEPFLDDWLRTPMQLLGGMSPVQAIAVGRAEAVLGMVHRLRSGEPG